MSEEGYTDVCVLKRCGKFYGNKECCRQIEESGLRSIVLESIWEMIEGGKCAQYLNGTCISRKICRRLQTYCYPIPLRKKKINKLVASMFAYYCAEAAEVDAYADVDSYVAVAAYSGEVTVDEAVYAALAAEVAASAVAYNAREVGEVGDAFEVGDVAREQFYREASEELVRLIDAWGTPIKEE